MERERERESGAGQGGHGMGSPFFASFLVAIGCCGRWYGGYSGPQDHPNDSLAAPAITSQDSAISLSWPCIFYLKGASFTKKAAEKSHPPSFRLKPLAYIYRPGRAGRKREGGP